MTRWLFPSLVASGLRPRLEFLATGPARPPLFDACSIMQPNLEPWPCTGNRSARRQGKRRPATPGIGETNAS